MATHWQSSFRRGAFAATAVAGLAASAFFPSQALAQTKPTPAAYQGTAACAKFAKNDPTLEKAVKCEARELDRRTAEAVRKTAEAKRRGEEADRRAEEAIRRGAAADRVSACTEFLMAGLQQGRFSKEAILAKADGKVTATNACGVARSLGHSQKAELIQPSVN